MTDAIGTREQLVRRFEAVQVDLDPGEADEIATDVLGGTQSVAEAARRWAASGIMPETPAIEGLTPASLAVDYLPTQVFTILWTLADDPSMLPMLKRFPKLASSPDRSDTVLT